MSEEMIQNPLSEMEKVGKLLDSIGEKSNTARIMGAKVNAQCKKTSQFSSGIYQRSIPCPNPMTQENTPLELS